MNEDHGQVVDRTAQSAARPIAHHRRPAAGRFALVLVIGSSAMIGGWLWGQQFLQSFAPRDSNQEVFVRDSAVAVEKFALAGRMERLKEWDKAADVYQDLLKSYADKVYPVPQTRGGTFAPFPKYTSVANEALSHLEKWPADALAIYRNRYEGEASAGLDLAHDQLSQLHGVMALYFITDAGKRAATRMMDLYFENGEFPAVCSIGDQMLDQYPDLSDEERPKFLYRTALAHHFAGDEDRAKAMLKELSDKYPQAKATIRGQDLVLADALTKQLSGGDEAQMQAYMPDNWPIVFGSPDRSRVPESSNFGGARLFGIDIAASTPRSANSEMRKQLDDTTRLSMNHGYLTGIYPVVDRGEMFFQDNARVYAVSLESGLPLSGWAQTYDGQRNGRYTLPNAWPLPISQDSCLTVTDDFVLAVMGQVDMNSMDYTGMYGVRDSRLVCLDRETGRQKWIVSPKQLPTEVASLRTLDLSGSPLVVGDTVYIQAHGGRGLQFEDFYVLAFNLADGKFKWDSFIVSANSSIQFFNGGGPAIFGQAASHLAYSAGRVYALSNLGAVAAIDAYDGSIDWLDLYPRDAQQYNQTRGMRGMFRGGGPRAINISNFDPIQPWTFNPVIVTQGKVFVLPDDGLYIHVYDAQTGAELKRISRGAFENADTMLGVVDEKLIVNTDDKVICINWQKYDSSKGRAEDNEEWESPPLQRSGVAGGDSIQGRGFVTHDSVIIPTKWQLFQFSLNNQGKIAQTYPAGPSASWGEQEGPGNVLVTQDRLIIAGPAGPAAHPTMRVNVYTDIAMAMAKLDAAVAAAPNDPAQRLRYAEVMFAGGKIDIAIAKLDEAIKLLAAPARPGEVTTGRPDSIRDRIFNSAMTFAQKLAKENRPDQVEMVSGLFERAGMAASTPSQKVNYRLSRAQYEHEISQAEVEVKLYQQILADPEMRSVAVGDANGTVAAAGDLARRQIDEAIARTSPAVYAPFERAAGEMMLAASKAINPDQLQAVAQIYPNSTAASRALLLAGEIYESNNNSRAAVQVLRQAYLRYSGSADAPRIVEGLARNYLRLPGRIDVAIARLRQGAALASAVGGQPQPRLSRALTLPDGRKIDNLTFTEAADELKSYSAKIAPEALPDVGLPAEQNIPMQTDPYLPEAANSTIPDVDAILLPAQGLARFDRVVTFTSSVGLRVFAAGSNQPLIRNSDTFNELSHDPDSSAWVGRNLLVWGDHAIACFVDGANAPLWKRTIKDLPALELINRAATPSGSSSPTQQQQQQLNMAGNVQIQVQQGVLIIGGNRFNGPANVQVGPGGVLINGNAAPAPAPAPPPQPGAEQIKHVRVLSDRVVIDTTDGRVAAIALDGGRIIWEARVADHGATHLLASEDFVVVHTRDENGAAAQITVFDVDSGQVLSRSDFGSDTDTPTLPVNMALSPDGMLIVMLPGQILGKDLFQPGGLEKQSLTFMPINVSSIYGFTPFSGSVTPDYLQIMRDRFVAVGVETIGGAGGDLVRSIRMYDLHTGKLLPFNQADKLQLEPSQQSISYLSRTFDDDYYLAYQVGARGIDFTRSVVWKEPFDASTVVALRDMIVTKNHLVVIVDPSGRQVRPGNSVAVPSLQLYAYSRILSPNETESGRLDFNRRITDMSGIVNCQLVEGGLYYLSGDHKLHYRQGLAAVKQ